MSEGSGIDVTCIVVNYFCSKLTLEAVRSFHSQCPDGRIVVVDNSADESEQLILSEGLPANAQLIVQSQNIGFGGACNLALIYCDEPMVLLINPDVILMSDCVAHLREALASDPELGAVSPMQFWDRSFRWMLPPAWLPTGIGQWTLSAAHRNRRTARRLSRAYHSIALKLWSAGSESVVEQRALSGGAMMLRREAVATLGLLFDPTYFMYYEDSDLCLRFRRKGWKLAIARSALVVHEWTHSEAKIAMMETSQAQYFEKNFSGQGQWETRLQRAVRESPLDGLLPAKKLAYGTAALPVPKDWQAGWVLEAGPSPLLIPALGFIGSGASADIDWSLMRRMGETSHIFLRLCPLDSSCTDELFYEVIPEKQSDPR